MLSRLSVSPPLSTIPLSHKILRMLLALSMALATLCTGLLYTTSAQAATPRYLDGVLGPIHIRVQWNLADHRDDYIGTPYVDWTEADGNLDKNEGPWWSHGIPSETGAVGMNDAGFIAHVIMQTGYSTNNFATMNTWFDNNPTNSGATTRTGRWANVDTLFDILKDRAIYKTFDSKEALLKSDYLQKCDIIIMKCDGTDNGGTDDFGRHHDCAHKSHVGFFYGEDSDEDVLWHSNDEYYGFRADEILTGNNLSRIQPSCWGSTYYVFKWEELGRVMLWRTPNNTELVRNNASYSFYDCWHNTSPNANMVPTNGIFPTHNITTDEQRYLAPSSVSGCAMPGIPTVGTLYMQGTSPGKGYVLDDTIYRADVKRYNSGPEQVTNVYSIVKTKYNPLTELVSTYDKDRPSDKNTQALPSGNATLQGAQFRVRYYATQLESYEDTVRRTPSRNWIFQTDPTGKVTLSSDNSTFTVTQANGLKQSLNYQLSGNAIFTKDDGTPVLSLGTYLITPYKASEGYKFEDENAYSFQLINDTSHDVEVVNLFEAPTFTQSVIRGGVHISVEDADHIDKNHLSGLAGAEYQVRNDSSEAVVVNNKTYQPGEIVATMSTNDIGYAATDTDALPYGTYSIQQTKAYPGGTIKDTSWTRFTVGSDNELVNPYKRAAIPTPVYGGIRVAVFDHQTAEATPQGDASFEDIAFEITNASENDLVINNSTYEPGALIDTIYTNADGVAETSATALRRGTYTITPKAAPVGYGFDNPEPRTFSIEEPEILIDPFTDNPLTLSVLRGGVTIERHDAENNSTTPQGNGDLSGATYAITNESLHPVVVDDTVIYPGEIATTITIEGASASTYPDTLPYGTYSICETSPSPGYYPSGEQKTFSIREQGQMHSDITGASAFRTNIIKGGLTSTLQDYETQSTQPLGSATLGGAQFSIVNTSTYPVWIDGRFVNTGETCMTLSSDYNGLLQSGIDSLPVGSYKLRLFCTPKGFERPRFHTLDFSITQEGYLTVASPDSSAINLSVIRSDITLSKMSEEGPLAHIPYRITSKTTGESHIIVTDENGIASTSASHAPHTSKTNSNDAVTTEDYDASAGIWFGTYNGFLSTPDDARGALPYDTYLVEELRCSANEGCELDVIDNIQIRNQSIPEFSLNHPQATITKQPSIDITPSDVSSSGVIPYAPGQTEIFATITYEGLVPGQEYLLSISPQILTLNDDGSVATTPLCDPQGNPIVVTHSLIPESESGSVTIAIPTYGADLSLTTLVFFNELSLATSPDVPILSHKDPSALPGVSLSAKPMISARASESTSGSKVLWCASSVSLTDAIGYYNLIPGSTYEITTSALIVDPITNESWELTDTLGNAITTSKSFTPESTQGVLTTSLTLDTTQLAGYNLVVCESITRDGEAVVACNDPLSPSQTLAIKAPHIQGSTTDASDNNRILSPFVFTTLNDSVTYEGLVPGNEYTLKASVMIKSPSSTSEDGAEIVPLIQDEKPVEAKMTFTPESSCGSLDLTVAFSTEALAGYTILIYEELLNGEKTIATNHNPQDANQTLVVTNRTFHSFVRDAFDKDSALSAGSAQKALITTEYRGLVPGETYTLMALAMDAQTGLPYQNALSDSAYAATAENCWSELSAALHAQTDPNYPGTFAEILNSYYGSEPSFAWSQTSFVAEKSDSSATFEVPTSTVNNPQGEIVYFIYAYHNTDSLLSSFEDLTDSELTLTIEYPTLQASYLDAYDLDMRLVAEEQRQLQCELSYQSLEATEGYTLATIALDAKTHTPIDTADNHTQRLGGTMHAHQGSQATWNLLHPQSSGEGGFSPCNLVALQSSLASYNENPSHAWVFTPISIPGDTSTISTQVTFNAASLEGKQVQFATCLFNPQGELCTFDATSLEALPSFEILPSSLTTKVETPGDDGKTFTMSKETTFTDTLSFNNLGAHLSYSLLTILMDPTTGLPTRALTNPDDALRPEEPANWSLLEEMRKLDPLAENNTQLAQAQAIAASLNAQAGTDICFLSSFIPEVESGNLKPEFTLNTLGLENDSVVVYEYVFAPDGSLRAMHTDLSDNGSTLYIARPLLSGETKNTADNTHIIRPEPNVAIANEVSFRGVEPHSTYELVGTIMDKATNTPMTANGAVMEKVVSFTPETSDGSVTLEFNIDASGLNGHDLVVFNTLYQDGKVITSHRDYEDARQSLMVLGVGDSEDPPQSDPPSGDDPSTDPGDTGTNKGDDNKPNNPSNGSSNPPENPSTQTPSDPSQPENPNNTPNQTPGDTQKGPNAFLGATSNNPNASSPGPDEITPQDAPSSSQNNNNKPNSGYYAKTGRNLTVLFVAFGLCAAGCIVTFILGVRNSRKCKTRQD